MQEKPTQDQSNNIRAYDTPSTSSAPLVSIPGHTKFVKLPKFNLRSQKLPTWAVAGVLAVIFLALVASCFLLYKKSNDLSLQNKNLNTTLDVYKKAATNSDTDTTDLQTVTSASDTHGGTAEQVNVDDLNSATPKYKGGEYAPFWLLNKFALTVPDGIKMTRTTYIHTDGRLWTAANEGSVGCEGEGIYMTVSASLQVPGHDFKALGTSSSYKGGFGCGGPDPISVVYAKYAAMPKASQYKYMELVAVDCTPVSGSINCSGSKPDKTKWRLFSGILLANAKEYKPGDPLQAWYIEKQLTDRDKNSAEFYLSCPTGTSNAQYYNVYCSGQDYKNKDYNVALKDTAYVRLKAIIINMHDR